MSKILKLNSLNETDRKKIIDDLQIEIKPNKYSFNKNSTYLLPYDVDDENVYIPYNYNFKNTIKPDRKDLLKSNIKFEGELRDYQKEIVKQSIDVLNKNGSVIISAYPGFGKCLGKDTKILMYNGTLKNVQDLNIGEIIMGDNSKQRYIKNINTGIDTMYKIILENNDNFICNKEHILCLYIEDKNIQYVKNLFSIKNNIIEIEVKKFIKYPECIQKLFKSYKRLIHFSKKFTDIEPYFLGCWLFNSNIIDTLDKKTKKLYTKFLVEYDLFNNSYIPHNYKCNNIYNRVQLLLGILKTNSYYVNDSYVLKNIYTENLKNDIIFLCKSLNIITNVYGNDIVLTGYNITEISNDTRKLRSTELYNFEILDIGKDNYYGFEIDDNKRFILGDFTVTHNTSCSLYLISKIQLKTVVLTHRIVLIKQWEEAIKNFCPTAKIQIVKKDIDLDNDIFIINPTNVPKYDRSLFKNIGILLCDEAHLIMTDTMIKSFSHITPRYNIALTATPYRVDGRNKLFSLYYSQIIDRKLYRHHIVYTIKTGFTPEFKLNNNGKMDWGSVIDSISSNVERNNLIIKLVKYFSKNNIIIPVKRIVQGTYLFDELKENKEHVTSLLGNQQEYDKDARILIGTIGKTGCGFDKPNLNMMIAGIDIISYYVQVIGRILRTQEGIPIIIELLDDNPILMKHYRDRKKIYLEHGGVMKNFNVSFPDFKK